MRIERVVRVSGVVLALALSACGSILQTNTDGGGDGGGDAGPAPCRGLTESACRARNDCAAAMCSLCGGGPSFAGCYDPAREPSPVCTGIACPAPCSNLDAASCGTRADCRVDTCPSCNGGSGFVRCAEQNDPLPLCPAIACPQPTCTQLTGKDACEARPDCHSVYVDGRDCACAALGCCARWSRCADGATALCKSPGVLCDVVTPYCEGPYVVSYTSGCYEGCVLSSDCAVN
jgi:hypothetical protein